MYFDTRHTSYYCKSLLFFLCMLLVCKILHFNEIHGIARNFHFLSCFNLRDWLGKSFRHSYCNLVDEVKKENPNSLKTINQTHTIIFSEHVTIDKKRIEIWDERKCARLKLFSRKLFEQNECPKYR